MASDENEEPDFSEFEDWMMDGPAGVWPDRWTEDALSPKQQKVVTNNTALINDREAWHLKVARFEQQLNKVRDADRAKSRSGFMVHFDRADFEEDELSFSDYVFPCSISFDKATFAQGHVDFLGATFRDGDVSFSRTDFSDGIVDFEGARFGNGDINFEGANFGNSDVDFYGAVFGDGDVSFLSTIFGEGDVDFEMTTFGKGNITFQGSIFGKRNVLFIPESAVFTGLSFQDCKLEGNLLVGGKLPGECTFQRLEISGTANFKEARFTKIPDFRYTNFNRPPEVAGMRVGEPEMQGNWPLDKATHKNDASKFRKLKSMALSAHDHAQDGYFFSREMLSKRGWETRGSWSLLLDSGYRALSGYGQSVTRPLVGFCASFVVSAIYYALFVLTQAMPLEKSLGFSAEYSFRNTFPLTNTLFRFALQPNDYESEFETRMSLVANSASVWMDAIIHFSVAQQAIGAVLLFLLLLGLRNRFRMK